jgi:hypothetical protein
MPRSRAKSGAGELATSHTIPMGGAMAVILGTLVGITLNNPCLAGISLCIGAGGLFGWLLAGRPARGKPRGQ